MQKEQDYYTELSDSVEERQRRIDNDPDVHLTSKRARLCIDDYAWPSSEEAFELLRVAGFKVSTLRVAGLGLPILHLGNAEYYGIDAIRQLVQIITDDPTKGGSLQTRFDVNETDQFIIGSPIPVTYNITKFEIGEQVSYPVSQEQLQLEL